MGPGVVSASHTDPPSVVSTTTPATWSGSGMRRAVTQQWVSSGQDTPVAPLTPAGSAPRSTQVAPAEAAVRAAAPPATSPTAMHRRSARHETAVMSRKPGGIGRDCQERPPSVVARITASPLEVEAACPTATHWRWSLQEMAER